jgi:pimeloyl-ACP methyl ester carboxylesterase
MPERLEILGSGGRRLDVELSGPQDGQALLFHTGTPSAGLLFDELVDAGAARGLRHVAYSRPGYAGSDRHEGRSVADCVVDVCTIVDELGIERFFTVGASGGGPHALACAALLPERTIAAATIASVAPRFAEGLDWLDGMGEENVEELTAATAGGERLREYLEQHGPTLASASGSDLHDELGDLLADVDRRVLTGAFAEHLADSTRRALVRGIWGWFDDDLAFIDDWGFDLGAITRPVTIWQGAEDRFVPFTHGRWLAGHVAGAQAQLRAEHGHLSLVIGSYGEVLDGLLASAG